jgi:hypothetical protein
MSCNARCLLALLVTACAGATYHGRLAEAAAPRLIEYECAPPATAAAVGRASENFMSGRGVAVPQPGDDACEVLLALGLPTETHRIATASGRSQSLWYRDAGVVHVVQITFDPDRTGQLGSHWLVDTVNW